jgi:hypothetical protein
MSERIFTAEQIKVPAELPGLLKELAKEAIRNDPTQGKKGPEARKVLALWAAEYLTKQQQQADGAHATK